MKLLKKIILFFNAGYESNVYKENFPEINRVNGNTFSLSMIPAASITGILFIMSFFLDIVERYRFMYLGITLVFLIGIGINKFYIEKNEKSILPVFYVMIIATYIFAVLLGTLKMDSGAATIFVMIAVLPIFILNKPWKIDILTVLAATFMGIMSFHHKDITTATRDTINAYIFTLCSLLISYLTVHTKVENILSKAKLIEQGRRDNLTHVLNRGAIQEKAEEYLHKEDSVGAMLLMDLDNFKGINDNYGHAQGDEVLVEMADILVDVFDSIGYVGRIGGDEFIVFIPDEIGHNELLAKANQAIDQMTKTYGEGDNRCNISACIGIAFYPRHGIDYEGLYRNADRAMYVAKASGKSRSEIYNEW